MAVINLVVADALDAIGRQLRPRQDQTSGTSQIPPSNNVPPDPTTAPSPSPNQPSGGPTSSPLLFFVALGFGVVFTNLWIIVGVKYCFRYNARNRAIRNGEEVDPIGLDQMHARPHRRRREKKLMTMDEVNERFPLMKYKSWVASRAREGLPTSGGVSMPASRAPSMRDVDISTMSSPTDTFNSAACQPKSLNAAVENRIKTTGLAIDTDQSDHEETRISEKCALSPNGAEPNQKEEAVPYKAHANPAIHIQATGASDDEDDEPDEDDQINTVIPSELLASPGDSCAICIDTLEEEDEIRGLSCGHAFHAGCLDPWLTSRRACCPLCKADYHTPKARPEGEILDAERTTRRRADRANMPLYSQSLWSSILSSTRLLTPQRTRENTRDRNRLAPRQTREVSTVEAGVATSSNGNHTATQTQTWAFPSLSNPFRNLNTSTIRASRRNRQADNIPNPDSPSQLEAGVASR